MRARLPLGLLALLLLALGLVSARMPTAAHAAAPLTAAAGSAAPKLPVLAVALPSVALPFQDLVGDLVHRAAAAVINAGRQLSPSLGERLDSMLAARRGSTLDAPRTIGARMGSAFLRLGGIGTIGLIVALVVLVTALGPLEGVVKTVEADVAGAFWRGVLAQTIALPILAAVVLALAATVIGLLVVPVVLFAGVLAIAGVATLGLLAVMTVVGRARASGEMSRSRRGMLRALLFGYALFWLPWLATALLVAVPGVGLGVRVLALASTWVLATVGTGAVVRSRGGVRIPERVRPQRAIGAAVAVAPDWSTPTPIGGVVAARGTVATSTTE